MAVYKRGDVWWYKFRFANRVVRESSKTQSKTVAKLAEAKRRRELEEGYNNLGEGRNQRVQTIREVASAYLEAYKLRHRVQVARLKEGAAGKTVNEEVGFLLRFLDDVGMRSEHACEESGS